MRNVAILIDGGFFLRRITALGHHNENDTPEQAIGVLKKVIDNHLRSLNQRYGYKIPPNGRGKVRYLNRPEQQLYRVFYYDAHPYEGRATKPISRDTISFKNTSAAQFRRKFFTLLKQQRALALRMGDLAAKGEWILNQERQKKLISGRITVGDLTDDDFKFDIKQKGVDMRIGLDIASITLKKQANTIVLITGDSDFVSAAKLARREGVELILDPLRHNIKNNLFEHIDGLRHGLTRVDQDDDDDDDA